MRTKALTLLTALLLTFWLSPAAAQQKAPDNNTSQTAPKAAEAPEGPAAPDVSQALSDLLDTIERTEQRMAEVGKELKKAQSDQQRQGLQSQLESLAATLAKQRENLRSLATGLTEDTRPNGQPVEVNWQQEMLELLYPMLNELKKFTARPREIDRLRTEVESIEQRLPVLQQAKARLSSLQETVKDKDLANYLKSQAQQVASRLQDLQSDMQVAKLKLDQILGEKRSLPDVARDLFANFFQTRGKNLLAALVAFFGVFSVLRFGFNRLRRATALAESGASFYLRLLDVTLNLVVVLLAVLAALAVLYAGGDWVLLGLTLILLFGVVWSAKSAAANFFEQTKLVLNIGNVREGERIIYNDLPWQVERLHYYSILSNPALTGGRLRVRLTDLIEAASRPFDAQEPWFPTEEGHWVVLEDGTYGRVLRQTPEAVELVIFSSSIKTYRVQDFLAQNPKNLSRGFGLFLTFGLDYQHQAEVTSQIPETLKQAVAEALENTRKGEMNKVLLVEFAEAADSSLNVIVYATFDGAAADLYYPLQRAMNKALVDSCTANGWVIPFPQLTVSAAPGGLRLNNKPDED